MQPCVYNGTVEAWKHPIECSFIIASACVRLICQELVAETRARYAPASQDPDPASEASPLVAA